MRASHPAFRTLAAVAAAALLLPGAVLAQVDTGGADFSRYVALGDSLTAGFASGGLVDELQATSYPALIHFQATGQGGFQQPLVSPPGIPPLLTLVNLVPVVIAPQAPSSQQGVPTNLNLARPYDNLGIPGCRAHDLLATPTLAQNSTCASFAQFILRPAGFGNASALQQALLLQPTFVSLWIGPNDALGAVLSGIVIDGVTLTPVAPFEADYRAIVGAVRAAGAQMALATIPDVTALPYANTIPSVVVNPTTNQPVLVNGQPVPLLGPNGPLTSSDRVLLSASTPLSQGIGIPSFIPGGTGQALGTQYVLSAAEAAAVTDRVNALNEVIRAVARDAGAALVDIHDIFNDIVENQLSIGGIDYNTDFLTGGLFSYDGFHASAMGYAIVANEFVKAINRQFGGDIPQVDLFSFTFGSPPTGLSAAEAKSAIFTPAAYESLRQAVGVPKTRVLLRMLRQGGNGPGDEPDAGPAPGSTPGPVVPDLPRPPHGGRPAG